VYSLTKCSVSVDALRNCYKRLVIVAKYLITLTGQFGPRYFHRDLETVT
jgi:hypothetical protein